MGNAEAAKKRTSLSPPPPPPAAAHHRRRRRRPPPPPTAGSAEDAAADDAATHQEGEALSVKIAEGRPRTIKPGKTIEALVADEDFSNEHLDRLATSSESESSDSDEEEDRRRFELLKVLRNVFSRSASCCGFWVSRPSTRTRPSTGPGPRASIGRCRRACPSALGPHGEERAEFLGDGPEHLFGRGPGGRGLADYATKVGEEKDAWRNEIMLERSLAAAGHEQHKLRKRVRLAKRMIKELEAPAPKVTESQLRWGKIRAHVTKRRPQQGSLLPTKEKVLRLKRVVWRAKLGRHGRANAFQRVSCGCGSTGRSCRCGLRVSCGSASASCMRSQKERWSATRAIYFAVSSLSTAGLQGIPLASKDWQYAFVGVWCLVGVPLFAAGVGELAGLFVREDCEVEARAQEWGSYGESDWDAAVGALRSDPCGNFRRHLRIV